MKSFAKIITIFIKSSTVDVGVVSKYYSTSSSNFRGILVSTGIKEGISTK